MDSYQKMDRMLKIPMKSNFRKLVILEKNLKVYYTMKVTMKRMRKVMWTIHPLFKNRWKFKKILTVCPVVVFLEDY